MRIVSIASQPFEEIPYYHARRGGGKEFGRLPVFEGWANSRLDDEVEVLVIAGDLQGIDSQGRLLGVGLADEIRAMCDIGLLVPANRVAVLLTGDLYADPNAQIRGATGDVGEVFRCMADNFRWVAGVLGNHDLVEAIDNPNVFILDGGKCVEVCGLKIAGIGGVIGKNPNKPGRHSIDEYRRAMNLAMGSAPDVLILHEGPAISESGLPGSNYVTELLVAADRKPLVFCGHCGWPNSPMASLPGGQQIVNFDGRAVILRKSSCRPTKN